jgi:hypothetical protein
MGCPGENGWSIRSQGWRMCKAICLPFETDLLPLTNSNYYISSDNHSFTHTSRLEHSMSWIVAEGDISLPCTLMKLVKWETRVVALKRCSSFGERVGFFWSSQCVPIKVPNGFSTYSKNNWAPWLHAGSRHWLLRIRMPTYGLYHFWARLTGGAQTVGHSFVFRPKLAMDLEVSAGIWVGKYYFFF